MGELDGRGQSGEVGPIRVAGTSGTRDRPHGCSTERIDELQPGSAAAADATSDAVARHRRRRDGPDAEPFVWWRYVVARPRERASRRRRPATPCVRAAAARSWCHRRSCRLTRFPLLPNGKVDREALATAHRPTSGPLGRRARRRTSGSAAHADLGRSHRRSRRRARRQLLRARWALAAPAAAHRPGAARLRRHAAAWSGVPDTDGEGLAEIIQAGNPTHSWRSLVGIRESGRRPPLYMVHGLGGEIGYFYNLAEYLNREQPVFGLQAPVEPFGEIEAMASHYLEEVRSHQPHGPYLLGGYCVGGCVAFEMAQQLVEAGESVRLLAIVDAAMPGPQSIARRLKRFASKVSSRDARGAAVVERERSQRGSPTSRSSADRRGHDLLRRPARVFHAAAAKHYRAQSIYAPRPYDGDMWLFRSEHNAFDADLGWGPLVRGQLQVRTIPGQTCGRAQGAESEGNGTASCRGRRRAAARRCQGREDPVPARGGVGRRAGRRGRTAEPTDGILPAARPSRGEHGVPARRLPRPEPVRHQGLPPARIGARAASRFSHRVRANRWPSSCFPVSRVYGVLVLAIPRLRQGWDQFEGGSSLRWFVGALVVDSRVGRRRLRVQRLVRSASCTRPRCARPARRARVAGGPASSCRS